MVWQASQKACHKRMFGEGTSVTLLFYNMELKTCIIMVVIISDSIKTNGVIQMTPQFETERSLKLAA